MKRHQLKWIKLFLIFLVLFNLGVNVAGQIGKLEPDYTVEETDEAACELNSSYLDILLAKARNSNDRIFVISRLSKTESSKLNRIRLTNARLALTDGKGLSENQVITAIGDRIVNGGRGRLEFYLGSRLFLVSKINKNKIACLTCCDTP